MQATNVQSEFCRPKNMIFHFPGGFELWFTSDPCCDCAAQRLRLGGALKCQKPLLGIDLQKINDEAKVKPLMRSWPCPALSGAGGRISGARRIAGAGLRAGHCAAHGAARVRVRRSRQGRPMTARLMPRRCARSAMACVEIRDYGSCGVGASCRAGSVCRRPLIRYPPLQRGLLTGSERRSSTEKFARAA